MVVVLSFLVAEVVDIHTTYHIHHPHRIVSGERLRLSLPHQSPHMFRRGLLSTGKHCCPTSGGVRIRNAGSAVRGTGHVAGVTGAGWRGGGEQGTVAAALGDSSGGRRRHQKHDRHHEQAHGARYLAPHAPLTALRTTSLIAMVPIVVVLLTSTAAVVVFVAGRIAVGMDMLGVSVLGALGVQVATRAQGLVPYCSDGRHRCVTLENLSPLVQVREIGRAHV